MFWLLLIIAIELAFVILILSGLVPSDRYDHERDHWHTTNLLLDSIREAVGGEELLFGEEKLSK